MIARSRHFALPTLLTVVLSIGLSAELRADAKASGGTITLLHDEPGHGGGRVTGGPVTAETSTGGAIAGGVTDLTPAGVRATAGYTGQLYDPRSLILSATPGITLNEGDAARLSAGLSLDDGTTLPNEALEWTVLSGPVTLADRSLAIAGAVTANDSALIEAGISGLKASLRLSIINLDYHASPISWDPGSTAGGPYRVMFGTQPSSLSQVSSQTSPHYNPGQLAMGKSYYYQIFDSQNIDVTPGGPGPQTFRTALYRPDIRIGRKSPASTHRGNGVYNKNARGQTLTMNLYGKRTTRLYFSVENDGDGIDHHTIRASKAGKRMKLVRYYRLTPGRRNVTASATRRGFTQTRVIPKSIVNYQIQAKSRGSGRTRQTINLIARSVTDGRALDAGRAKLKNVVKKTL